MNKKLITELMRTREIMGLKTKNYNLLIEQFGSMDNIAKWADDIYVRWWGDVDPSDINALNKQFRDEVGLTDTVWSGLLGKHSAKLPNDFKFNDFMKMLATGNVDDYKKYKNLILQTLANTRYNGLVADVLTDAAYVAEIHKIIPLNQLKSYLAGILYLDDASEFIAKITDDISEQFKKLDGELDDGKKADPDDIVFKDLTKLRKAWNKLKLMFKNWFLKPWGSNLERTQNEGLIQYLSTVTVGGKKISTVGDIRKLLLDLQSNIKTKGYGDVTSAFEVNKLVDELAIAIKDGKQIPDDVLVSIWQIVVRGGDKHQIIDSLSSCRFCYNWLRLRYKHLKRIIGSNNKNVSEADKTKAQEDLDLLYEIFLGPKGTDRNYKLLKNYFDEVFTKRAALDTFPVAFTKHKTIMGVPMWVWTTLGMTGTFILSSLIDAYKEIIKGEKPIAGTTPQLYERFRGFKEGIYKASGITDDAAKAIAEQLFIYLHGWEFLRDQNEEENFQKILWEWDIKQENDWKDDATTLINWDQLKENNPFDEWNALNKSAADLTGLYQKGFWDDMESHLSKIGDFWAGDSSKFMIMLKGTDDDSIMDIYRSATITPTVMACSQIAYFYNGEIAQRPGALVSDLTAMNSKLPFGIGYLKDKWGTTKYDVYNAIKGKEWTVGSKAAGEDKLQALETVVDNWPTFREKRGVTDAYKKPYYYCVYQNDGYVPTGTLARITDAHEWDPYANDFNPLEFQQWLNEFTATEWNEGACYGLQTACSDQYINCTRDGVTDKDRCGPEFNMKAGTMEALTPATIKLEFQNAIDAAVEWYNDHVKEKIDSGVDKTKEILNIDDPGRNPRPNIEEGLIRVLKGIK